MRTPRHRLASLGGHQRKMSPAFRICARPISSKKERTFFFGVLPSKYSGRWRGDNSIRSGMAEFPPHPPSAMPSLGAGGFRTILILNISYLNIKGLWKSCAEHELTLDCLKYRRQNCSKSRNPMFQKARPENNDLTSWN